MRYLLAGCLAILITGNAIGQEIQLKLGAGTWRATGEVVITVDANGTMSFAVDMSKPFVIIQADGDGPPPEDPPPKPDPDKIAKFRKALSAANEKVTYSAEDATKLSREKLAVGTLYGTVGNLPVDNPGQLHRAVALLFARLGLGSNWNDWKKSIDKALEQLPALNDAQSAYQIIETALKNGASQK